MANGTEYAIEIGARLSGVSGAASALDQLSAKLTASGEAAKAAQAAVDAGQAKYNALEKAADQAAKALERAGLKTSGSVPADLKQKADAASAALRAEASALDQLKSKAQAAAAAHEELARDVKAAETAVRKESEAMANATAFDQGTGKVGKMASALGNLGGPLGAVGQQAFGVVNTFQELTGAMGATAGAVAGGLVVVAALTAALVALGAALVVAAAKTAIWAVGLADTKRNAELTLEALKRSSDTFAEFGGMLPGIARDFGLSLDAVIGLAKSLEDTKVAAADMPAVLRAIAMAEAALPGEAAKWVAELKKGKMTATEVAQAIERKFGGVVAKKMLAIGAQTARLKKNISDTFGGLQIEPFLVALSKLIGMLDQSTASGRFVKKVFEGMFQPLVDAGTKAIPLVRAAILGLAIGAVKIYIAFKPAIQALREFFGAGDSSKLPSALEVALFLGKALAATIGVVAVAIAAVGVAIATPIKFFFQLYGVATQTWESIKAGAAAAVAFLSSFSLSDIGAQMVQGLADGITGAGNKVLTALGGVVQTAISNAKSMLKIGSPSKLFAEMGGQVAAGFAGGIEGGTGDAKSALSSLVEPPDAGGGGARGGGNRYVINITAPEGTAEGIAIAVREVLLDVLEGDAIQIGAAEPEPAT